MAADVRQRQRVGQDCGATLVRESFAARAAWFAQAPGNWAYRQLTALLSAQKFAHLAALHRVSQGRPKVAIASAVGVQFYNKKPTVSEKVVCCDMAIREVLEPPIVEGGMAVAFRPFKVAADQLIEPMHLHGGLVDLDARRRERSGEEI